MTNYTTVSSTMIFNCHKNAAHEKVPERKYKICIHWCKKLYTLSGKPNRRELGLFCSRWNLLATAKPITYRIPCCVAQQNRHGLWEMCQFFYRATETMAPQPQIHRNKSQKNQNPRIQLQGTKCLQHFRANRIGLRFRRWRANYPQLVSFESSIHSSYHMIVIWACPAYREAESQNFPHSFILSL